MTAPSAPANPWFPAPNADYGMPFWYASLTTYWVYWQVPVEVLRPHVGADFVPVEIGGSGLVVVNPQLYTSIFNNGQELTTETEFNIVVAPRSAGNRVPQGMSLDDYLAGNDQTKLIGNLRLHVACDDKTAVAAGRAVFGEPKFVTTFTYNVPTINAPDQVTWSWCCNDPHDPNQFIFDLQVGRLTGPATGVNPSPITGYTYLHGRPVGSRWNPLGPSMQYDVSAPGDVVISYGGSTHKMRLDMQEIIGTRPAVAMQVFASPPVCAESGPFYVDT
jgi:hypothetical protein